jgi:hypothetical protein
MNCEARTVKQLVAAALVSVIGISLMKAPRAEAPPLEVRQEIDFLLDAIGSSGCDFYRNGSWHDAKTALAHVRDKYSFLLGRDQIATTEDFIQKAASKSSLSGEPYRIRCGNGAEITTGDWLRDQLARFRSLNRHPDPNRPNPNRGPEPDPRGTPGHS